MALSLFENMLKGFGLVREEVFLSIGKIIISQKLDVCNYIVKT